MNGISRFIGLFSLIIGLCPITFLSAKTYKCQKDNVTTYQSISCTETNREKNASPECKPGKNIMSLYFQDMAISNLLQNIADFSHHKLVIDSGISDSGSFIYYCKPWDAILRDIAVKYKLDIHINQNTIYIKRQ